MKHKNTDYANLIRTIITLIRLLEEYDIAGNISNVLIEPIGQFGDSGPCSIHSIRM